MEEEAKIDYNGDDLKGIISFLTENNNGDIDQIIKAEASSCDGIISYNPKNVLRLNKKCYFVSKEEENASLTLDFQQRRILLHNYTIKAREWDNYFLTDWKLQGSNDNCHWIDLDERTNEKSIKGLGLIKNFEISKTDGSNQSYRFIRILLTDVSSSSRFYLSFSAIEFFGVLYKCTEE